MVLAESLYEGVDIDAASWVHLDRLYDDVPEGAHEASIVVDGMTTAIGDVGAFDNRQRIPQQGFPDYDRQIVNGILTALPKCWHSVGVDVRRTDLGDYDGVLFVFVRWYGTGERGVAVRLSPTELRLLRSKDAQATFADAAVMPFLRREAGVFRGA